MKYLLDTCVVEALLKAESGRPLSLRMIRRLHDGLRIPYERLLAGVA